MPEDDQQDPILDAAKTQHAADQQVLINEIGPARMELARLKVAYYAAKAEVDIGFVVKNVNGSKEQRLHALQKIIDKVSKNVNILQAMYQDISTGNPIPQPESALKVVTKT
jgi:hypothetical protein